MESKQKKVKKIEGKSQEDIGTEGEKKRSNKREKIANKTEPVDDETREGHQSRES